MSNDKFECTWSGDCLWVCCMVKTKEGFKNCEYLKISSDVDDEKRG